MYKLFRICSPGYLLVITVLAFAGPVQAQQQFTVGILLDGKTTGYQYGHGEIKHVEAIHAHVRGHVDHQQVGGCSDRRCHAAHDAGETHRDKERRS